MESLLLWVFLSPEPLGKSPTLVLNRFFHIFQGHYDYFILNFGIAREDASHLVEEPNQYYPVRGLRNLRPHHRSSCFLSEEAIRPMGCIVFKQRKLPNSREFRLRFFLDRNYRWPFKHLLWHLCWSVGLEHRSSNLSKRSHLHLNAHRHHLCLCYRPLRCDCRDCREHSIWWLAFLCMKSIASLQPLLCK